MSARPTIEERMGEAEEWRAGVFSMRASDAARIAKEYAAERTEPLVKALEVVLDAYAAGYLDSAEINPARAALEAERAARQ